MGNTKWARTKKKARTIHEFVKALFVVAVNLKREGRGGMHDYHAQNTKCVQVYNLTKR